jgi:hypothetical protein
MLYNTNDMKNFKVMATDGEVGTIKDSYFDDDAWVIRYFLVETLSWLSSRKVLISPAAIELPDWQGGSLNVSITGGKIEGAPAIDTDKAVSRQMEEQYLEYYGYPRYWVGQGLWGQHMYPNGVPPDYVTSRLDWIERQREDEAAIVTERARHRNGSPQIRSCDTVSGYHVQTRDGEVGHISSFLVDEVSWAIRYLVVDTSNWWTSHNVLIAPPWISGVHWDSETVSTDLSRDAIHASPVFDLHAVMDRAWEVRLHQHYSRIGYWSRDESLEPPHR